MNNDEGDVVIIGDRANIYIRQEQGGGIYLYTHWNGYEWPERLRQALIFGRGRWTDESYLTRIIATRVFADLLDSETGGGISTYLTDNSYDVICVDPSEQVVGFAPEGAEGDPGNWGNVKSFEDFVKAEASYPNE